ncbi:MAG TPA: hypothetical protein VJ549_10770 [Geothrix sp.]|nr:hypothetical protein [Geothrix sp.]
MRWTALLTLLGLPLLAQAPMLQDGAAALRQARLDWTLGQTPLGPSSMPSLEVGWGGADAEGPYAPLMNGEGLGHGTRGWGLGLQGRYVREGWTFAATALAFRDEGHSLGVLQRATLAYQTESGWRAALEAAPFAWGSGLLGDDLLGDASRPFPRLSLSTPELGLPFGASRMEAFAGRLERTPVPDWISDRETRLAAQAQGLDLRQPWLWGAFLRTDLGSLTQVGLGAARMEGGEDALGRTAPADSARTQTMAELRLRLPALARWARARGAALVLSRSAAPAGPALSLSPARDLGGLQLAWEDWDLGLEYAGSPSHTPVPSFSEPTSLAGFSNRGDALGPAFGRGAVTRTVALGLPLFLEGRGRLQLVRGTAPSDQPLGPAFWCLQAEAQWRTPTGRFGTALASLRQELSLASASGAPARWGWTCSVFQAFRVF